MKTLVTRTICILILALLGVGAAIYATQYAVPNPAGEQQPLTQTRAKEASQARPTAENHVVRSAHDQLILSPVAAENMQLKTMTVMATTQPIDLPSFQGVLALDNDRLSRIHSRFDGEVVEIGTSTDGSDPTLRVGEKIQRGDLLAVIWSTELGQKKSQLVDALTKLRAEEQLRNRLKKLSQEGAVAGRNYLDADKEVQGRLVEVASLDRTLRTWRISDEELEEIREEANRLADAGDLAGTTMPAAEIRNWARVEIRAPISGIILEKNVVVGDIVDTNTDLFKIGDLSQLAVWAHVYEDDLPLLEALPIPIRWTISSPSRPGFTFAGTLENVGAVIDPTQHTALMTGRVDNQSGILKIGQFVNVTVQIPPPKHELALPATTVVEDGLQSVVFTQPLAEEFLFQRIPVQVTRRFRDSIYVRFTSEGLRPNDVVVTSGALMLQNVLDELPPPMLAGGNS